MWRPDNWERGKPQKRGRIDTVIAYCNGREAGADAILEALKAENGWYGTKGSWDTYIPERMGAKGKAGWLVFVEE